jgi:glycosyltransferase involved in cell wall biosynthesis
LPGARRTVFWVHNPAGYLMKWRYLSKLWRYRPAIVFIGDYHATTYPAWAPAGERIVIPYGVPEQMCSAGLRSSPPEPIAVFTSNPLRSLDWLLEQWRIQIQPRVPGAQLHLYSGAATYGSVGDAKSAEMEQVLDRARSLADQGVRVYAPVSKQELVDIFRDARVMLYKGDLNETFCAAVAEAQAAGVPAVVQRFGSVVERVRDRETGHVTDSDAAFADAAVGILSEDNLWQRQHAAALQMQRKWTWSKAAAAFERLIPA